MYVWSAYIQTLRIPSVSLKPQICVLVFPSIQFSRPNHAPPLNHAEFLNSILPFVIVFPDIFSFTVFSGRVPIPTFPTG